jgi:hypothetical protein
VLDIVRSLNYEYFHLFVACNGGEMHRIVTRRESPKKHVEVIEEERCQWQRE